MMPTPGMVFNWLLGNTDAHVKNFSLLYSPGLRRVRLAPAYDLVSTAAYRQSTREMAFYEVTLATILRNRKLFCSESLPYFA